MWNYTSIPPYAQIACDLLITYVGVLTNLWLFLFFYKISARISQKTPLPKVPLLLRHVPVARPRREYRFPITPLVRVTNLLRSLPSNGRCLHSYYLATGLHARIRYGYAMLVIGKLLLKNAYLVTDNS
jgi:hypothetical protein